MYITINNKPLDAFVKYDTQGSAEIYINTEGKSDLDKLNNDDLGSLFEIILYGLAHTKADQDKVFFGDNEEIEINYAFVASEAERKQYIAYIEGW